MDLASVTRFRTAAARADLHLAEGERLLAGGTWLFSEPQPEVSGLVDLTSLGWAPWEPLPGGGLRVAATCTIAQLLQAPWPSPELPRACADALLMSFKIQHAATVGGNLCLALPAGAMIALAAALAGEAVVWTPDGGERREPVTTFVRGPGLTSLTGGEVLRGVDLPGWALRAATASGRAALTTYGRSAALVIGRRDPDAIALTITASVPRPVVLMLPPAPSERTVRATVAEAGAEVGWYADPHGAPDWRAAQTGRLAVEVCEALS